MIQCHHQYEELEVIFLKEKTRRQIRVVTATNGADFERKFNEVAEELAEYEPEITMKEGDGFCAYFLYNMNIRFPENESDQFSMQGYECHCSDCPFLEIGTDARRKTFPCKFSKYGETRIDAPACARFYEEAVKKMREEAGR